MSDEQKNIDDGKRWQVDYTSNLVWDEVVKSEVQIAHLKALFANIEDYYDILDGSFEKTEGPYYRVMIRAKEKWKCIPQMDDTLIKDFYEPVVEYNVAFLTIQKDTRENNKKGNEKIVTSNLKAHINSVKLRCQGNLFYPNLDNKIIIARYSYEKGEEIDKSLYVAFPEEVIGNGQKSYRVNCSNLQKARMYGIYAAQDSEYKEVIFNAKNIGVYFANRECLHGIKKDKEKNDIVKQNIPDKLIGKYNRIIFGAPGTGKSFRLQSDSLCFEDMMERVTFHPNYSYAHFVGTYKPVQGKGGEIKYEYIPGPFMRIYSKAKKNPHIKYLLLIEEINRANVAAVFGDVFQLLDRKAGISEYKITTSEDVRNHLLKEWYGEKTWDDYTSEEKNECAYMEIPDNMYIWATMNSADQGVFPMDTAFKRRWDFEYLGIDDNAEKIKNYIIPIGNKEHRKYVYWNELRTAINDRLSSEECKVNEDKLLGPFFISKSMLENALEKQDDFVKTFESKVLMYLFEDAMKMSPKKIFEGHSKKNKRMIFSEICKTFEESGIEVFGFNIKVYDDVPKAE